MRQFFSITLPQLKYTLITSSTLMVVGALTYFDIIFVTTNGGPGNATKIIPIRLYETAFRFFDLGYAATIGLSMLVFSIVIALLFVRILKNRGLVR